MPQKIKEVIEVFNVTCPCMINNTSPNTVPCLNYSHYTVHCLDDVGAWSYYCPKDLSTSLSCSRILENVTSDYSELCDVECVLNGNVSCVSVASI